MCLCPSVEVMDNLFFPSTMWVLGIERRYSQTWLYTLHQPLLGVTTIFYFIALTLLIKKS